MFRKFTTKQLLIAFGFLLAIVITLFLIEPSHNTRSASLKETLFEADTASITKISIYEKGDLENPVILNKKAGVWMVKSADKYYTAGENQVTNLLGIFTTLNPKRVAATSKDRWKEYQVTDSLSTRVVAETNKKVVCDIHIGKFSYLQPKNPSPYNYQQRGTMISYVRLDKDKSVYAVDGFLSMSFNREAKDFRSSTVINSNKSNWTSLNFQYRAGSSFTLTNENGKWLLDGILADSAKVAIYLSSLSRVSSSDFVDDQKPVNNTADYSLQIDGNNFAAPITVEAYITDTIVGPLISSSQNKEVFFSGKKSGLFDKVFKPKDAFVKMEE